MSGGIFASVPEETVPNALVSFKAGAMFDVPVAGTPRVRVTPDRRKGLVALSKESDGLVYFTWRERGKAPTKKLPIFPKEAKMTRVPTGTDSDRVYQLKFTSGRREYFWMQSPDESTDEENIRKMNTYIDNPAAAAAEGGQQQVTPQMMQQLLGGQGGGVSQEGMAALLQQMSAGGGFGGLGGAPGADGGDAGGMMDEDAALQAALAASLNDVAPASAPAPAPAPAPASAPAPAPATGGAAAPAPAEGEGDAEESDTDMTGDGSGAGTAAGALPGGLTLADLQRAMAAVTQQSQGPRTVPLHMVATSERVLPLVDDPAVQERLLPLLPEGQQTVAHLREILVSPQFRSSLGSLTSALQTSNFNTVFANFGLNPADGADEVARGDGVGALVGALQANADRAAAEAAAGAEAEGDDGDLSEPDAE